MKDLGAPSPGAKETVDLSIFMKLAVRPLRLKSWILLAPMALWAVAGLAQNTNVTTRALSLDDCIRIALEHNLDVQIQRYNPKIAKLTLDSVYGSYDPKFNAGAQQHFSASAGGFSNGLVPIPNTSYDETFNAGLAGILPSGLNYSISSTLDRNSGDSVIGGSSLERGFLYSSFTGITLSQPLLRNLWTDSVRQQISLNRKSLKISELGVRLQVINVIGKVEQAYYDLVAFIENVKVQQTALELAERLLKENKERVTVGVMAQLDEKSAESQVATSRAAVLAAQSALVAQQNLLKSLLTDAYSNWHDVDVAPTEKLLPQPHVFDVQQSWVKGMTMRPDLLQQKLDLERQNITLKYLHNQVFPELDLVGSYGRSGLGVALTPSLDDIRVERYPSWAYGVQLSIPLGNRAARNNYRAQKETIAQELLTLKKLEQSILVQIDNDVKTAQSDFEQVAATREARLYAEAALDAEEKKLQNGKSTSYNVLLVQRDLTAARSNEIQALANYNKALSQLAVAEGTTLELHQLTVEVK